MTLEPVNVLLVEDNPGDILLTKKAFEKSRLLVNLHVVTDGQSALDFVRREGAHETAVRPELILLDINLPKVDGFDVLQQLKSAESSRDIPVVMLTSSDQEQDILRSYRGYVNSYITKPPNLRSLIDAVEGLSQYWFALVRRPLTEPPT